MIDLGPEICGSYTDASSREWLVTNGIGGYGMGTVAGTRTRRYHGLLVAALTPPAGRTLLLANLDLRVTVLGQIYGLNAAEYGSGAVDAEAVRHMTRFHLEGTTPVWTFACADALIERRVWMAYGENTTYVSIRLARASGPVTLTAQALVTCRDHHETTHEGDCAFNVTSVGNGLKIDPGANGPVFWLLSGQVQMAQADRWERGFFLRTEQYRGLDSTEDLYQAGEFTVTLEPGEEITLAASTNEHPDLDGAAAYRRHQHREQGIIAQAHLAEGSPWAQQLALAADQFVVRRPAQDDPDGLTILAGYPWFADWGRDTMIALPGLLLETGRAVEAARVLRTFARHIEQGMLPNRFPERGEQPEYNTVDATLWYFEAIRATVETGADPSLLSDLYPYLVEIVKWHVRGTRYSIHADPEDGLLYAGEPGIQLTWMDARVAGREITPRTGKAVEVNALWIHALHILSDFSRRLGLPSSGYDGLIERARSGFSQFWNAEMGCCYDVIDGPSGNDPSLRPNQIIAAALPSSPLTPAQRRAVVDICARRLYTRCGLRSLDPDHPDFHPQHGGPPRLRDAAYHQGTVWGWLIGPFVSAHLLAYGDPALAYSYLEPVIRQMHSHGLGTISEIFDGDPPFTPRGCIAQAWSVAEVLRSWELIRRVQISPAERLSQKGHITGPAKS
jgi:predicted glycogen debranching enzyme